MVCTRLFVSANPSAFLSDKIRIDPFLSYSIAKACPIPEPEPVITAILSLKFLILNSLYVAKVLIHVN